MNRLDDIKKRAYYLTSQPLKDASAASKLYGFALPDIHWLVAQLDESQRGHAEALEMVKDEHEYGYKRGGADLEEALGFIDGLIRIHARMPDSNDCGDLPPCNECLEAPLCEFNAKLLAFMKRMKGRNPV